MESWSKCVMFNFWKQIFWSCHCYFFLKSWSTFGPIDYLQQTMWSALSIVQVSIAPLCICPKLTRTSILPVFFVWDTEYYLFSISVFLQKFCARGMRWWFQPPVGLLAGTLDRKRLLGSPLSPWPWLSPLLLGPGKLPAQAVHTHNLFIKQKVWLASHCLRINFTVSLR